MAQDELRARYVDPQLSSRSWVFDGGRVGAALRSGTCVACVEATYYDRARVRPKEPHETSETAQCYQLQ
jgi:hypothetical protein